MLTRTVEKRGGLETAIAEEVTAEAEGLMGERRVEGVDFEAIGTAARRTALRIMNQALVARLSGLNAAQVSFADASRLLHELACLHIPPKQVERYAKALGEAIAHDELETLRRWWDRMGRLTYPKASRLRVTADGGGSNGSRTVVEVGVAAVCRRHGSEGFRCVTFLPARASGTRSSTECSAISGEVGRWSVTRWW